MPRQPRTNPVGVPQHVIQRGNNRQACFISQQDYIAYAGWLKNYSVMFKVQIHAWVFMSNHVHILCTPQKTNAISQMMQSLGRQYVRYFNYTHQRTGTLWEGRFKSCLVQTEDYLLQVYRYIELNPVRANIVKHPAEYPWSSYQINALGKVSELCYPHPIYLAICNNPQERLERYTALCEQKIDEKILKDIRQSTNKCKAFGNDVFKSQLENITGHSMKSKSVGRPLKNKA
ncbi:transposase [Shewanella gaetbuli]